MATVLGVDDRPDICAILELCLTLEEFGVLTAWKGCEALQHLHDAQRTLILPDLMMPAMDGGEVRRERNVSRVCAPFPSCARRRGTTRVRPPQNSASPGAS